MLTQNLFKKIFGSRNERIIRKLQNNVNKINELSKFLINLSDAELKAKTNEFKNRLKNGATLESLLPESFAVVREASSRTIGLRHFDVQLIGGMVLHAGNIAEMHTGEGKTLVATLPAYLNALTGKGVHIVTVNDYLAARDAEWMRPVYEFLDLSVGVILNNMPHADKKAAYAADITYGTNNEFGFDYLRDNMAFAIEDRVQRPLHYAIVDEVDSILIDEARTPLIISGPSEDSSDLYQKIDAIIPLLSKKNEQSDQSAQNNHTIGEDYTVDEKTRQAYLTEAGHQHVEELLVSKKILAPEDSLYSPHNAIYMHHLNAALRAHSVYHRDVDYVVQDDQIVIVDEHTGRTMPGRRWSEGLHQAIEAKEKVKIQNENQTLASITFQNYFRLYEKLAGMTGTADTEAYEFHNIYNLEVVVIPTNKLITRQDLPDSVYLTIPEKYQAITEEVKLAYGKSQPILLGTASIEHSEILSNSLKKAQIPHRVLNAKFHQQEAEIIAEAGRPGRVTIATNMAGRGTDIVLGGSLDAELALLENPSEELIQKTKAEWKKRHQQVLDAGGLYVIGSERHESRRVDNQLRGRSGRQGDPGKTRFFLSLDDNLLRIFASENTRNMLKKLGMGTGEPIESRLLSKMIENAQRKVESFNFDMRKQLLEYDDIANEQRKVIYEQRTALMQAEDLDESVENIIQEVIQRIVGEYIPAETIEEQWNIAGLEKLLMHSFKINLALSKWLDEDETMNDTDLRNKIMSEILKVYADKKKHIDPENFQQLCKNILLQSLDHHWKEHLVNMDYLRQWINLRGYAQKDPKQEYKRESFSLFVDMLEGFRFDVASIILALEISAEVKISQLEQQRKLESHEQNLQYQHNSIDNIIDSMQANNPEIVDGERLVSENNDEALQSYQRQHPKIGRNDPCFCGSGKKYKHCCGRI